MMIVVKDLPTIRYVTDKPAASQTLSLTPGAQVQARVDSLANAIKSRWNIGEDDVGRYPLPLREEVLFILIYSRSTVAMFSPNHVDYAITIWAAHRIGAIISYASLFIRVYIRGH